jgi:predicted dienelactone hydrolase
MSRSGFHLYRPHPAAKPTATQPWPGFAPAKIAVIGHSLGAYTTLALAGARVSVPRLQADCQLHSAMAACQWYRQNVAGKGMSYDDALEQSLVDHRVTAVISLDIGFARSLSVQSLLRLAFARLAMTVIPHRSNFRFKTLAQLHAGLLIYLLLP